MYVLGVGGFYHDFNAALVDLDSGRIFAAEEERFSRKKHHPILGALNTSIYSIKYCITRAGVDFEDIDYVAISDVESHPIEAFLKSLFPNAKYFHVDHHNCHLAAAFFSSGYEEAAILSMDGFGDLKSSVLAYGEGSKLQSIACVDIHNSIGHEYLRATYQLGLGSFGSEGKTQGLAAYGEPTSYESYMNEIRLLDDGIYELSDRLKSMKGYISGAHYMSEKSLFNDFLADNLQRRFPDEPLTDEHKNMASSIQKVLETLAKHSIDSLANTVSTDHLVIAGGVAQNSSMNGYLLKNTNYKNVYAHPSSSDRGNALGAALYFVNVYLGENIHLDGPIIYGGSEFSDNEIADLLEKSGLETEKVSSVTTVAAELIASGSIIGWFQGRSELGARALGNRSILGDPRKADNKDIINTKVKHREWFRPFAPSVLDKDLTEWFDIDRQLPHMQFTVPVREKCRGQVPAITHVDGSARVQSVSDSINPLYYELIEQFKALSGVPMVINTSFNDAGDAIVETPGDAMECFQKTDMDALIIGSYVVCK